MPSKERAHQIQGVCHGEDGEEAQGGVQADREESRDGKKKKKGHGER